MHFASVLLMSVFPEMITDVIILHLPFYDFKCVIQSAMSLDAFNGVKPPKNYRSEVGVPVSSFNLKRQ